MWVLLDTESLKCINISEWFLFHAYISDVTSSQKKYRALSGKITMKKCRYRLGLNAMLVLFQVIEIIGSLKCWTTFRCICTLNRIKQSSIHTNNNIKIRCLTMAFFSSPTPCYYPTTTTTNINSHTTLHR